MVVDAQILPVRVPNQVVDGFVKDPDAVRASVIAAGVGTWRPNKGEVGSSIYDGMGFWGDHATMVRALAQACGRPVYPSAMFFRVTHPDTEAAYIHSDRESGDYTCVAYLSKHEDGTSGTAFWRHRESGVIRMPSFAEMRHDRESFNELKREMVEGSEEVWERVHFVEGKYNRCAIFEAPLFHSRHPRGGFGSNTDDGRMVWVCHFFI